MHENREISWTPCRKTKAGSLKAINRTADMNVQEKSDCVVVPMNRRTTKGYLPRRLGRTSFNLTCTRHRAGNACPRDCAVCGTLKDLACRLASSVRAVCVNALVRICAGASSNRRPYRDQVPLGGCRVKGTRLHGLLKAECHLVPVLAV